MAEEELGGLTLPERRPRQGYKQLCPAAKEALALSARARYLIWTVA